MSLQITYRYRCATEGTHVTETKNVGDAAPTVCVNEGAAIVAGTLTIITQPDEPDEGFKPSSVVDFSAATVTNLSHTSLSDIGSNTHAQIDTHLASTSNPHSVTKAQVGLSNVDNLKNNLSATGAPGTSDDSGSGYAVGSRWIDVTNDIAYTCLDATSTAAVWREVSSGTNTHAQIDSHIADAGKHREINDAGSGATDLWSASKISSELSGKSATSHTHTASDVTDFSTAADARISAQKAAANGLATLGADSKIPSSQLPALSLTDVHVVADITARDALTVQEGDVAKVTDAGSGSPATYIYDGSSWIELESSGAVQSVNSKTGAVTLTTTDIGEGTNLYYTDARFDTRLATKSTSDVAEGTNLYYTEARVNGNSNVTANSTHRGRTDNPHSVTKTQVGLSNVQNTKVNLAASAAPTASDDTGAGYSVGSVWVDTTNDHAYRCVDASSAAAVWRRVSGGELQATSNFATTSSIYSVASGGTILFPGAAARTITGVRVVASIDNASVGYEFDVRLVDTSNSDAVIAEATGLSGTSKAIHSLGSISNVPTSDAILEVQLRRSNVTTGSTRATLFSVLVEYA